MVTTFLKIYLVTMQIVFTTVKTLYYSWKLGEDVIKYIESSQLSEWRIGKAFKF